MTAGCCRPTTNDFIVSTTRDDCRRDCPVECDTRLLVWASLSRPRQLATKMAIVVSASEGEYPAIVDHVVQYAQINLSVASGPANRR